MATSGDSDMFKSDVWTRTQSSGAVVSDATYNMVIGVVLCWGFFINWLIVRYVDPALLRGINPWVFFIGYFASCFYGVYLFNTSEEPAISFIGYNFVVVPFGVIVNLVVSRYDPNLVLEAIRVTAMVTIVMMTLGVLFADFFRRIETALFIALAAVILIELFHIFILHMPRSWTDWVVVLIFCGYVGVDWGRANRIPKTLDNAIDSAAAIYMDVINLFLRILSILGRSKRR